MCKISSTFIITILVVFHVCNYTLLQWLEKDFLGYLAEWDEMMQGREDFTAAEKKKMTLSKDTLDGLHMTGVENCVSSNVHYFSHMCMYVHVLDCSLSIQSVPSLRCPATLFCRRRACFFYQSDLIRTLWNLFLDNSVQGEGVVTTQILQHSSTMLRLSVFRGHWL